MGSDWRILQETVAARNSIASNQKALNRAHWIDFTFRKCDVFMFKDKNLIDIHDLKTFSQCIDL
jgi:hypothetical protein